MNDANLAHVFTRVCGQRFTYTALHKRKPANFDATLTARTIEHCIMLSVVSAVSAVRTTLHKRKPVNHHATLTAWPIEFCITFSLVSVVSALLAALHKRKPVNHNATLTTTAIKLGIMFSLVLAVSALLTAQSNETTKVWVLYGILDRNQSRVSGPFRSARIRSDSCVSCQIHLVIPNPPTCFTQMLRGEASEKN